MTTSWVSRPTISTTWGITRLGGAYLVNTLGEYILTSNSEKIIVIVPGGDIPLTSWGIRGTISSSWNGRTPV